MATLTIHARTATGTPTGSVDLPIRLRVRGGVARYNLAPGSEFVGLVQPDGASPGRRGFVMPAPRRIEWERQADIAIDSFLGNGLFVLVNGRQETELDHQVTLGADLDVGFVKLTPLRGG